MRVVAGTLTLSFWKEWRKFPPSSPSSRGVPGGLLMPLMLLGEFCRESRGGKPPCPQQPAPQMRERLSGWCCQGGDMEYTLTFGSPSMSPDPERKNESSSVSCPPFCAGASKPFRPSPNISAKRIFYLGNIYPLGIFLWGPGLGEPGAKAEKASWEGRAGGSMTRSGR